MSTPPACFHLPVAYSQSDDPGATVPWSVGDLLRNITTEVPQRVALIEVGDNRRPQRTWTYAALLTEAERVGRFLLANFKPGDHVAIWAGNSPEWIMVQFGAALAGMNLVAINPSSQAPELEHALTLSRARGLFLGRQFRSTDTVAVLNQIRGRLHNLERVFVLDDWGSFAWRANPDTLPAVSCSTSAMIQFTSGTTGKPKGAMLSHRGLVNIAQFSEARFALPQGSMWLNWLPLFHTGGCVYALMSCIWNRGTLVLLPGFDAIEVMRAVELHRVAWLPMVPTTSIALLDHPERRNFDLSSLTIITQGGTPIAPEMVRQIEREFAVEYVMVFGQTETSSTICLTRRGDSEYHKASTVGVPLPCTEVRIVDPTTSVTVHRGEIGEIQVRNFAVMLGYFDQPEATAAAIDSDGWLRTGDLGTMELDGYLTITGRLKDLIIRGGENIYPREIEDVLMTHPEIAETAVFGIPDPKWGEVVVAAVRRREGGSMDEATVLAFLHPLIARPKIPQRVWFVNSLPTTLSGKVQKFALRDAFIKGQR